MSHSKHNTSFQRRDFQAINCPANDKQTQNNQQKKSRQNYIKTYKKLLCYKPDKPTLSLDRYKNTNKNQTPQTTSSSPTKTGLCIW